MNQPPREIKVLSPAKEWARGHPSFFFTGGVPNALEIAKRLAAGATTLGSQDAEVQTLGAWHLVASETDWFSKAHFQLPENLMFDRMPAFPEAGQNETRAEFLAMVFAQDVVVLGPTGVFVAKGSVEQHDPVFNLISKSPLWKRAVGFRGVGDA